MNYIIKDKDTNLYVASCPYRLSQIEDAMIFDCYDLAKKYLSIIINNLAWRYLEQKYNKNKWFIDVGYKEFNEACRIFSNMQIVEINIIPKGDRKKNRYV